MLTHVVFGAGAVSALFPGLPVDVRFLLAGSQSLLVNFVIDAFGHTMHGDLVARSPLTHSVFTAPVWDGAMESFNVFVNSSRFCLSTVCRMPRAFP